jgi:hypothetical protein
MIHRRLYPGANRRTFEVRTRHCNERITIWAHAQLGRFVQGQGRSNWRLGSDGVSDGELVRWITNQIGRIILVGRLVAEEGL